ncbi:MAG TPA: hypothetical protein ENK55_00655 [Actinobacteria bacterium]|nr:hypothetical protein [Actinomycetota bacterium]
MTSPTVRRAPGEAQYGPRPDASPAASGKTTDTSPFGGFAARLAPALADLDFGSFRVKVRARLRRFLDHLVAPRPNGIR